MNKLRQVRMSAAKAELLICVYLIFLHEVCHIVKYDFHKQIL